MNVSSEFAAAGLLFSALSYGGGVALLAVQKLIRPGPARRATVAVVAVQGAAAVIAAQITDAGGVVLLTLALGLATTFAAGRLLPHFVAGGQLLFASQLLLMCFGLLWGLGFTLTMPVDATTRGLLLSGLVLLALTLPARLVGQFEQLATLCRTRWFRPRMALPAAPRTRYPKVSLHVPTYAEPPELVIATLDALAQLRYPNFEALVIDNNTQDPALWRPVEAHCRRLGERFQFFHVDHLAGAKAGALNYALPRIAPDAELISVVDSDYQAEPEFLAALVGFFDDPRVGFVQTPHDYRGWEASPYQRMCYWEYEHFKNTLASLNERDAAYTIGTMCLIRRQALTEAGGWAEWCLTEDSEVAIRIHALGYTGVYLTTTFGRGIIPESFEGYKRQRFRWTYGPVQQMKRHLRLLLPRPLGRPSRLTAAQKVHELSHALVPVTRGVGLLLFLLGLAIGASMLVHRERVAVPLELWVLGAVTLGSALVLRWLVYRVVLGCGLRDMVGASVASMALGLTIATASLACLLGRRATWRRTNKFAGLPLGIGVLNSVREELLLGTTALFAGASLAAMFPEPGLHVLLAAGLGWQGISYLTAPALALLAEWDVRVGQAGSRGLTPGDAAAGLDPLAAPTVA